MSEAVYSVHAKFVCKQPRSKSDFKKKTARDFPDPIPGGCRKTIRFRKSLPAWPGWCRQNHSYQLPGMTTEVPGEMLPDLLSCLNNLGELMWMFPLGLGNPKTEETKGSVENTQRTTDF